MFEAPRPIIQNMLSGKVPLPGAHANAPSGGRAASVTGKRRSVTKNFYATHNKRGQRRERM